MTGKPSILVVDADKIAQMLLSDVADASGYSVSLASTGREALDTIKTTRFAAALIDMNLPDQEALCLVRQARELNPHMEIIVLAAAASLETALDAFAIGAFDYITKPFDALDGLVQRIRRAVERWQRGEELRALIGMSDFGGESDCGTGNEVDHLASTFKQMTRALKDTQSQLIHSERMAAFGQLGAGITHEIRNPMTGIIGFAQAGQETQDQEAREIFQMIETEAVRCKEILTNFLNFARGDTTHMDDLGVNSLVQNAAKIFSHQLGMTKVRVQLDLDDNTPSVLGNAAQLQQVLLNLAVNAQQAMPQGGQVSIGTSRDGDGHAVITFADDGPGMPEDVMQKIFEPFFTTKSAGEGTGLGLAISFGIIRDHRGTIAVESEVGAGTTFTIALPAVEGNP